MNQAFSGSSPPVKNGYDCGIYCPGCTSDGPESVIHELHRKCYKDAKRTHRWREYDSRYDWPEGSTATQLYLEDKARCEDENLGEWVPVDQHWLAEGELVPAGPDGELPSEGPPEEPWETSKDGEWRDAGWQFFRTNPLVSQNRLWMWKRSENPKPRGYMGKPTGKNSFRVGGFLKFLVSEGVFTRDEAIRLDDIQFRSMPEFFKAAGIRERLKRAQQAEDEAKAQAMLNATAKPCPRCGLRAEHWRGHGCHHITCRGQYSKPCHHSWFYVCGQDYHGPANGCPSHGSTNCSNRCDCIPCPDCRPPTPGHPDGHPCGQCGGPVWGCTVCTGAEAPGAREI